MIRKTIITLLALLAVALLLVGWAGEHGVDLNISSQHRIINGEYEYWPKNWPLEKLPQHRFTVTLHGFWGEWISLGSTHPFVNRETRYYDWLDVPWRDKNGNVGRSRIVLIKAPLIPLASMFLLTYPGIAFALGPCRRFNRRRHGQCLRCGYSLIGNTSGHCPECGLDRAIQAVMRAKSESWTRRLTTLAVVAMFILACWGTLSQIRDAQALEYYRENPWRLLAVLILAFAVALGVWLAGRARAAGHRTDSGRKSDPSKKDIRPIFLIGGITIMVVGSWLSDMPNWLLAALAGVAVYSFVPPILQRRRGLARLRGRPAAVLDEEYQEIVRRGGLERAEVETLWDELATFYEIPPTLVRASDKIKSDLSDIVGHPDYELFFFEPKILADNAAQGILAPMTDWADLIIGIHEIRHGQHHPSS